MSRYIGPKLRIIRRLGKLRGFTRKKPFRRVFRGKVIPPGQHGLTRVFQTRPYDSLLSDYLIRLKVKQRLRFNYGLTERQLMNYVRQAKKSHIRSLPTTLTTPIHVTKVRPVLLQLLEMRLDNIVFRLGMAPTIAAARQLVSHEHIQVNNKKVNIPSYLCKPNDVISVAMKKKSLLLVQRNLNQLNK